MLAVRQPALELGGNEELAVEAGLPEESVASSRRKMPSAILFGFDRTREISLRPAQEITEAAQTWGQNDDIAETRVPNSLIIHSDNATLQLVSPDRPPSRKGLVFRALRHWTPDCMTAAAWN